ncbi:unnamed protein product [Lactuca saligna]|uniref:Uncharacterized protein n=1 Tax=Lactuca saligna TaxID=75948 RepID=A0AA35YYE5_LACSI|nr:unnamed protein product [Lactuca saligna]
MEELQKGVLYYQALVANGLIEGEPGMVPSAYPGLEPEEYLEIDYEYGKSNEQMEKLGDIEEVPSKPRSLEMIQDHPAAPEDSTNWMCSLEEEVDTLRQQLLTAKA